MSLQDVGPLHEIFELADIFRASGSAERPPSPGVNIVAAPVVETVHPPKEDLREWGISSRRSRSGGYRRKDVQT
jgi:hypothetical protein